MNKFIKTLIIAVLIMSMVLASSIVLSSTTAIAADPPLTCTTADDWTNLLSRAGYSNTWLAADGIYTCALNEVDSIGSANSSTRTFFIFSDTILGSANSPGAISNMTYQNHSSAILTGNTPTVGNMSFKYGDKANMSTAQGSNLFGYTAWMQECIAVGSNVYVFGIPFDGDWKPKQVDLITIPVVNGNPNYAGFTKTSAVSKLFYRDSTYLYNYGIGLLNNTSQASAPNPDGYIYLYGYRDTLNGGQKDLIVSRVLRTEFPNFNNLKYWNGSSWSSNITDSVVLISNVSCEMSVTPVTNGTYNGKYIAIYTRDVQTADMMYAIGDSPAGPFAAPVKFYTAPEFEGIDFGQRYTYNAKAHPHLSSSGQLLISYNVNRMGGASNTNDYRPRFLKLNLGGSVPALPVTSGLVLNLDASAITGLSSGAQITTWNDISGNNNNASQLTASMKPTYQTSSKKSVRFDGGDQMNLNNINAQTVFIVTNVATAVTDNDGIIGWDGQDKGIRRKSDSGWKNTEDFTQPTGSIFRVNKVATSNAAENTWHLLTAIRGGSTQTMNVIGQYYTARGIEADICEIVVYNRVLTSDEMANV